MPYCFLNKTVVIFFLVFICTLISSCNNSEKNKAKNITKGETLFNTVGCANCHSLNTQTLYGPQLKYTFGSKIIVVKNNRYDSVTVTKAYIKNSIENPDFHKRPAYLNSKMPKVMLTPKDINCLVEYIAHLNAY